MKISVEYDQQGVIHAVVTVPPGDDSHTTLEAGPGRHLAQLDAQEVKSFDDYDSLRKVRHEYRIEAQHGQARLVKIAR
jgi:hypothetical protein